MNRTWARARVDTRCGGCGVIVLRDEPLLTSSLRGVRRARLRCVTCTGEPAPELAPLERARATPSPPPLPGWTQVAAARPLDRRTRAAGQRDEDEPSIEIPW